MFSNSGSISYRFWRRLRANDTQRSLPTIPKLEVSRAVRLPHHNLPVGVRVGGALAVEEQDTGLPANTKRPARLRSPGPQDLQQTTESRRPGLAGHDARICSEAHGLVCRLVVDGNEEVDAPEHCRPGDQ